jgi:hypothetical protein
LSTLSDPGLDTASGRRRSFHGRCGDGSCWSLAASPRSTLCVGAAPARQPSRSS